MQNWLQLSACLYIFSFTTIKWWVPSDIGQISLLNKTYVDSAGSVILLPGTTFLHINGGVGRLLYFEAARRTQKITLKMHLQINLL